MNGVSVVPDIKKIRDEYSQEFEDKAKRFQVLIQEHCAQPPEHEWGFFDFCWAMMKAMFYGSCCAALACAGREGGAALVIVGLFAFLVWSRNNLEAAKRQNDKMWDILMKCAKA